MNNVILTVRHALYSQKNCSPFTGDIIWHENYLHLYLWVEKFENIFSIFQYEWSRPVMVTIGVPNLYSIRKLGLTVPNYACDQKTFTSPSNQTKKESFWRVFFHARVGLWLNKACRGRNNVEIIVDGSPYEWPKLHAVVCQCEATRIFVDAIPRIEIPMADIFEWDIVEKILWHATERHIETQNSTHESHLFGTESISVSLLACSTSFSRSFFHIVFFFMNMVRTDTEKHTNNIICQVRGSMKLYG